MRCLLICGWEGCFKGKLEQRVGRNHPGKSQACSTGFNGRPAWLPDHHCLPHRHWFEPRQHCHGAGHTSAPCHEHSATAKVTRADPERDHGGGRQRRCTDRLPKRTAVVRGRTWPSSARRTNVNHSQFLQHKAGLRDIAVPSIFYAMAV